MSRLLHTFVLAIAAAFGVIGTFEARPPRGVDEVARREHALASLRPALPANARAGLISERGSPAPAGGDDPFPFYVAQYVLAPVLVRPIFTADCVVHGLEACGAAQLEYLIVESSQLTTVGSSGIQFVFEPAAVSNGFTLLTRSHR